MQFLYLPPSAALLFCDKSVEIIIREEDKEYSHVDNHCLEIDSTTRDDYIQGLKELGRGKIPLQQLWDSCSQNRESVLSGETPGQIAPFASSSDI